jgi:hypothetical protein
MPDLLNTLTKVGVLQDIAIAAKAYRDAVEATGIGTFATLTETRLALFDLVDKWEKINA